VKCNWPSSYNRPLVVENFQLQSITTIFVRLIRVQGLHCLIIFFQEGNVVCLVIHWHCTSDPNILLLCIHPRRCVYLVFNKEGGPYATHWHTCTSSSDNKVANCTYLSSDNKVANCTYLSSDNKVANGTYLSSDNKVANCTYLSSDNKVASCTLYTCVHNTIFLL